MTITFGSIGAKSSGGTTTLSIAYPASPASGDLFLTGRCMWDHTSSATDETGWTASGELTGGADNNTTDDHTTRIRGDRKVSDGTETGSVTFDMTTPATIGGGQGIMARYARSAGSGWLVSTTTGTDDTHGANRSVTGSGTLDFVAGDWLVAIVAVDTNSTLSVFSSPLLTASGITFGTTTRRAADGGVGTGNDGCIEWFDAEVSSGSGTVAPTVAFNTTQGQCGPVVFIRLREDAGGFTGTASLTETATITAVGGSSGSASLTETASITASGGTQGSASLTEAASITAQGTAQGTASLTATALITASGSLGGNDFTGTASRNTTATVTAAGQAQGSAALSATAAITAAGNMAAQGSASRSIVATITAIGSLGGVLGPSAPSRVSTLHQMSRVSTLHQMSRASTDLG